MPCKSLADLFGLLKADDDDAFLLEDYDVMLAMARHAMKYDAEFHQKGRPPAFATLNTGVIFAATNQRTHNLWRHWLRAYCARGQGFFNDQPDLVAVLYQAVSRRNISLYVLGPQWNMKKWRDDYMTNLPSSCCPRSVLIDHGCVS